MSTPQAFTASLFDLSKAPSSDVATFTPRFPPYSSVGVVGLGVVDDGIMVPDGVVVAADAQGRVVTMIVPTAQTRAGDDGRTGIGYRMAVAPDEYVDFDMAMAATTLYDILGQRIPIPPGVAGRVPAGGAAGDLLEKLSGADFDVGWSSPAMARVFFVPATYDAANTRVVLPVPGRTVPLSPTLHIAVLPADIARDRTTGVRVGYEGGALDYPLQDQFGATVVPSQLAPNVTYTAVYVGIGAGIFRFVEPIPRRPQDYTIYAAWRPYDATDPDAPWTAAMFGGARGGNSATDTVSISRPTLNYSAALAVPDVTGDVTSITEERTFGDLVGQYARVVGTIDIAGAAYKVWARNTEYNARTFGSDLVYTIEQEYP